MKDRRFNVRVQTVVITMTYLQSIDVVRKHNDLVSPILVILDEKLTRLELPWVHAI